VHEIIEQFFNYFAEIDFANVEEGSRFLVLAATLLAIKAQLVLPQPEQEIELEPGLFPREEIKEIVQGPELLTYQQFREAAVVLETSAKNWRLCYKRPPSGFQKRPAHRARREDILRLVQAFKEVVAQRTSLPEPYEVKPVPVDLEKKMEFILNQLQCKPEGLLFLELFFPPPPREEVIVTFLALLELVYQRKVKVAQAHGQGEIVLALADSERDLRRKKDAGIFS
jgi:segregation and condensation protein A